MASLMPHVTITNAVGPAEAKDDTLFNDLALCMQP
jgi:hypothetical protein